MIRGDRVSGDVADAAVSIRSTRVNDGGIGARRPRNFRVALQDRTGHPIRRNKFRGTTKNDETKRPYLAYP
jgi:hypothetical protein